MLSKIEANILVTVRKEMKRIGYSPSLREVSKIVNVSPETVRFHLISLERKGYVERPAKTYRAIKVLRMPTKAEIAA